jgi:hypothetical protein
VGKAWLAENLLKKKLNTYLPQKFGWLKAYWDTN